MFFVLLFLIYHKKSIKNHFKLFSYNSNTLNKNNNSYKYNGYDHRIINDTSETLKTNEKLVNLYKIQKYFEKKKILDILNNENVSLTTKILLLQDNAIKSSNLFEGGLMDNFEFDFEG